MYEVKQSSTAYPLVFLMVDSTDHVSAKTGLSPTVTLSKNGGSFASPSGSVTEIGSGWYKVAGNATDTATLGPLILHATGTAADPVDVVFPVIAFDPQDSVRMGLTAMPNAAAAASGGLLISGSNSGTTTLGALTVTGATTLTGNLSCAAGITVTQSSSNTAGISITGNGSGAGILATAGGTGDGLKLVGGSTSGTGIIITTTSGNGITVTPTAGHALALTANGTSKHGLIATGGTAGTSDGVSAVAGSGGVPIRGDITGNITGNLSGSAGSVTGLTNSTIADQVWDEVLSGHLTATTTGAALNGAGAAGDPWGTSLPGAYSAGTAGYIIGTNVDGTISSRASQSSVNTIDDFLDTEIAAIKTVTDALPNGGALTTIQSDLDDIQTRIPAALVSGRMAVDVIAISGDTTAADNAESFFDGTGYAGTNNVIPLVTTTTTATNVTTVNGLAANVITAAAIADGAIDRATFAADTGLQTVRSNTAQTGTQTTTNITLDASASATTDFYKGLNVYITGGTGVGQKRLITAYNGTSKSATTAPAWATNPDNTSTFALVESSGADIELISGTVVSTSSAQLGVNVVNLGGTSQTGRDIGASVLLSSGTGAGQVSLSSGTVTLTDASLTTAKLGTFALAKTTNITGFNDIAATAIVSGGAITTSSGSVSSVTTVGTLTTYTGNTPQTGDAYAIVNNGTYGNAQLVRSTTPANTLDVSSTGEAGLDFNNIKNATGATTLTNITVPLVTTTTTTTNVTTVNGLAANVITATSIASDAITDAKVASDVTIASVTGSVGSVTGLTNSTIADQVWDEVLSGHLTSGTTGEALSLASSAGDPWGTSLPGAYSAGTAGYIIGTNIDATTSSRSSQSSVNTIDDFLDTEIAAIKTVTDALPDSGALTTIQSDLNDIQTRIPAALVSGRMASDIIAISGDTVAADNAESFFDGTGYAGTNNVIPLVTTTTTATNVTTVNGLAANVITAAATASDFLAEINAEADTALSDYGALKPTTAGRTLDVSTTGEAGLDFDNIKDATGAHTLTNITVPTVTTTGTATNVTTVNGLAANVITATSIASDAITDAKVASDVTIASVTGSVGSVTGNVGGNVTGSIGSIASGGIASTSFAAGSITAAAIADEAIDRATFAADTGLMTIRSGTAQTGTQTTTNITLDASASSTTDFYAGNLILLTGGTGVGQTRVITSYNGTSKSATTAPAWATNPDNTSTFAIIPSGYITGVQGNVTGSVGTLSGTVTLADSSLTTAKLGTFVLAKTTNITGFNDIAATAIVSSGAITTNSGAVSTVTTVGTLTTYTGNTPQTGDAYAIVNNGTYGNAQLVRSTTPANTLDISSTGEAGLDFNNIKDATGSHTLTNITVPTVTTTGTATNVTTVNGLAANVITATSIASDAITDAKVASDVTIASVTGSVGSVTGLTNSTIADQVWDEVLSGHLTGGSTGSSLNAAGSSGDPWETSLPGAYSAGTAGYIIGTNIDATTSSRSSQSSVNTIDDFLDTEIAAIKTITDALPDSGALTTIQSDLDDIQTRIPAALVSGRMASDVIAISGDTTAADNAESFFDGTGYAGTNNVIPLVTTTTTATNVTTVNGLAANVITAAATASDFLAEINAEADTALSDYGALKPTTAGRTLDVSTTGEAGLDWSNIGSATTTVNLSGTTIKTATDVETDTQDIQSRIPAALVSGRMSSDAVAISGSTTAADNVEANIGNLDDKVSNAKFAALNKRE